MGTRNDLTAAVGRLTHETRQAEELQKRARTQGEARIAELESGLAEAWKRIQAKPSTRELRQAVRAANVRYAACEEQLPRLKIVRTAVEADASASKEGYDRARRELREFRESRDAGFVFRALKPECCPSCDEVIIEQRRRTTEQQHVCVVCGTPDRPQAAGLVAAEEARLVEAVEETKPEWEAQDGRKLAALRDTISSNQKFGWAVRKQFGLDDPLRVAEVMRVARLYGDRSEIFRNASWHALKELASSATSEPERRRFEARVLAWQTRHRCRNHPHPRCIGARNAARAGDSLRSASQRPAAFPTR